MSKMTTTEIKAHDEHYEAMYRARRAMFGTGPCARCGEGGIHVTHDPAEYRAIVPYHAEHPDLPFCEFVPITDGTPRLVDLGLTLRVTADEMRTWHPERISTFFAGIAMAIKARNGMDPR